MLLVRAVTTCIFLGTCFLNVQVQTSPATTASRPWWFVEYSDDGNAIGKNGKIFTESKPPVRYKTGGLVIGFSTFGFLIVMICIGWFCCTRNINTSHRADDKEDEEEKPKTITSCPVTGKPHGIKYIA
ncbi:uncharacterized protein LOC128191806 [Crassostrea angulata]|uniref:uncharacterized protein LOC128191806 n=1 Tax=Magallana angulata TaxID=2784310 RepID=UPI0022B1C66F|nr:uncharacterized protein LOC128191806 [Crassostrea angulata]